ncbi:MAG: hypothetical protein ABII09_08930 [Planctomycetota bacterium]
MSFIEQFIEVNIFPNIIPFLKWIFYPLAGLWATLQIAKYHFEREVRTKYLLAKDAIANQIIDILSWQLSQVWELYNLKQHYEWFRNKGKEQEFESRRTKAYEEFFQKIAGSYSILGKMGLYYGTGFVEEIALLQDELRNMIIDLYDGKDVKQLDDWENYRKQRLWPLLDKIHADLKDTVFNKKFKRYK